MSIKPRRVYLLSPSDDTCDEFPAVARYGNTACETLYFDRSKQRWYVRVGHEICYVRRSELVKYLGLVPKPLTTYQAAMLRAALTPAPLSAIKKARQDAGGCTSGSWDVSSLYPLLDRTSGVQVTDRIVTKRYADKMGWTYFSWSDSDTHVRAERPVTRHGYLTRTKVRGVYMYHITELGRAMLGEYDAS